MEKTSKLEYEAASVSARHVLFARIGYMKYYAGCQSDDEKPKHGGSYTADKIGHEVYNFKPANGSLYGYFQPYLCKDTAKPVTLNLARIDPSAKKADSIEDVLVAFVSRAGNKGQVIIGWYDNATVYRNYQQSNPSMQREDYSFIVECEMEDAVLLPEKYRNHRIPHGKGAFGRASVVYPFEPNGQARDFQSGSYSWIDKALSFIASYDGPNLLTDPISNLEDEIEDIVENEHSERSGQGFNIDSKLRKQIEEHAVGRAIEHFEDLGYSVRDVGNKRSYDLECCKEFEVLRVEVKGTQMDGGSIFLTRNEVSNAENYNTALYVLHSIQLSKHKKSLRPSGGEALILNPWQIKKDGLLRPLSFIYEIKK